LRVEVVTSHGKGVKRWFLLAERGDAVAASTTVGVKGGVFGVSAETKVKRYYRWEGSATGGAFFFVA
jgi:hypothetical protein